MCGGSEEPVLESWSCRIAPHFGGWRTAVRRVIALIDDATSKFWARFAEHDTTEENLRTLGGWLERYGRPVAHYTDKNSIFHAKHRADLGEQHSCCRVCTRMMNLSASSTVVACLFPSNLCSITL